MTLDRADLLGAAVVMGYLLVVIGLGLIAWQLAVVAIGAGIIAIARLA